MLTNLSSLLHIPIHPISDSSQVTRGRVGAYTVNGRVVALSLRGCDLPALPESIGLLRGLRVLDLTGNRLESLPGGLGDLSMLEKLYLDDNRLSGLPDSIGN